MESASLHEKNHQGGSMSIKRKALVAFVCLLVPVFMQAGDIFGLPVHVEKTADNAIRLWVGDYISSTAVNAIATEKGIVVIDSTRSPSLDVEFRKIIAKKLGRDDFKILINTHEHGDHTNGNQVYKDCIIIAHENCLTAMKERSSNQQEKERLVSWYTERIGNLKKEMTSKKLEAKDLARKEEEIKLNVVILKDLKAGITPTFPTKTFSDQTKLKLGDTTLELYFAGGMHSSSDIYVFVPEKGLLFTGDTMADKWLTDSPGCLRSFMVRRQTKKNFPVMIKNLDTLLAKKDQIKDYIPGHWNGDLSYDGFKNRANYIKTMWTEIPAMAKKGKSLEDILAHYTLEKKFPELVGSPGLDEPRFHEESVLTLFIETTGATSAMDALKGWIKKKGVKKAIAAIKEAKKAKTSKYFFFEGEFNALGYEYMNAKKMDEAIAVFELNTMMYPKSWNTYDSLAEAYMNTGNKKLAIKLYEKSIELNPKNENGMKMVKQMKEKS